MNDDSSNIEYIMEQVLRTAVCKYIYDMDTSKSSKEQFDYLLHGIPWNEEQIQIDLFVKVLKDLKDLKEIKPCLIELGSSGTDCSYYSLLFEKFFNYDCEIINTEPRKYLLDWVKIAWKNKHLINAKLVHGYSGIIKDICGIHEKQNIDFTQIPKYSVNDLIKKYNIEYIHILHCDIQGSEIETLQEILNDKIFNKIQYFFISLHNTYNECIDIFKNKTKTEILFEHPTLGGCGDGLIVAKNLEFKNVTA